MKSKSLVSRLEDRMGRQLRQFVPGERTFRRPTKKRTHRAQTVKTTRTAAKAVPHDVAEKARSVARQIDPVAVQAALFRFEGRFSAALREPALEAERSSDLRLRRDILMRILSLSTNALDISVAQESISSLLDMVTFITLARATIAESQSALAHVLLESETDIWQVAGKFMNASQRDSLSQLIKDWRERHPDLKTTDSVRFSEFSFQREAHHGTARPGSLLKEVRGALRASDAAVLLGERALYYAQRAPFIIHLQARVALYDLSSESLDIGKNLLKRISELHPVLKLMAAGVAVTASVLFTSVTAQVVKKTLR